MPSDPDAMGLKPCPFCGGPAEIESIDNERWSAGCCDRNEEFCMGYQSLTSFARRSDAIAAWNRRAPMGGVSLDREGIARPASPVGYRYLYPHNSGGRVWRFDTGGREINGSRPVKAEPVYSEADYLATISALAKADAILAALPEAGPAEVGWRPIESAPKDGTTILAWCVHPHARWATDDKEWSCPVVTQWITHNGGGWTWSGMAGTFTHWMPLPPPPLDRAGGGAVEGEG